MNQSLSKGKPSSALLSATGRDCAEWIQLPDAWDAPGRGYREIADWLATDSYWLLWWTTRSG